MLSTPWQFKQIYRSTSTVLHKLNDTSLYTECHRRLRVQSRDAHFFWFLVHSWRLEREKQQTLCFTGQGVHFSLWVVFVLYFSLRGVNCPSGMEPVMIKPCVTVMATHLKIISSSWSANQCAESQSFTAEAISVGCCFITTCVVMWTEKWLPSGSDWLQVESAGIAGDIKVVFLLSDCDLFNVPLANTDLFLNPKVDYRLDYGSNLSINHLIGVQFSTFASFSEVIGVLSLSELWTSTLNKETLIMY